MKRFLAHITSNWRMSVKTVTIYPGVSAIPLTVKSNRVESIDLLRGVVMIVMALDHVRDYFHSSAFLFSPTDLTQTNEVLFFTRFITHYSAPVFTFLAGLSAYLYGSKKTRKELSFYLFTRGLWLIFLEFSVLSLLRTFNPAFQYFNIQIIWAIGICMIILSGLIYLPRNLILLIGLIIIGTHNLLDNIHVPGEDFSAVLWSFLHDMRTFTFGSTTFYVHYPLLPWVGIMLIGYYFGGLYSRGMDPAKRKRILLSLGIAAVAAFVALRSGNYYGESSHWSEQKNLAFSVMSFLNVTKYPPSLLYILITLGPAMIFLALTEKPLNAITSKIAVYGRVPMFYYLTHILFIHVFALFGAVIAGFQMQDMILTTGVDDAPQLKGYGFDLFVVYLVWIALVLILYPCCKWYDQYKRENLPSKKWLSYV